MIRTIDLFSGIGGFALGLRRAGGFKTVCYVEIDPYCQGILQARQRDGALDLAPIWDDVTKFDGRPWRGHADLVCGGFPCQDISAEGKRVGIGGERSGLWREMHRVICEVRPRFVFVENVSALLVRGMDTVLGDLASIGYDAEWEIISAAAVGAPHLRERVWIVAYPQGDLRGASGHDGPKASDGSGSQLAYPNGLGKGSESENVSSWESKSREGGPVVADTKRQRCDEVEHEDSGGAARKGASYQVVQSSVFGGRVESRWEPEPNVGRVADGVPARVDRLRSLGNAVVPQITEWVGRRIMNVTSADLGKTL